jgi:iron complex transport system ATP-binding protein
LLRADERLAEGPVKEVLTQERLETLYSARVQKVADATGIAFLPG